MKVEHCLEDKVYVVFIFLQYAILDFYMGKIFLHKRYKLFFLLSLIIFCFLSWRFINLAGFFILTAMGLNLWLLFYSFKKKSLFSFVYILGVYFFIQFHITSIDTIYSFFAQLDSVKNPLFLLIGLQILIFLIFLTGNLMVKKVYTKNKIFLFLHRRIRIKKVLILCGIFFFILAMYFQFMYSVLDRGDFWLVLIILLLKGALIFGGIVFLEYSAVCHEDLFNTINFYEEKLERIDEIEGFKHDYEGILFTLALLLEKGDTEEAIEQLLKIKDYSKNIIFSKNNIGGLTKVRNMAIKSVLLIEINKAISMGIKVDLSIDTVIAEVPINSLDFIRCLKILLDNAIEASIETESPYINLTINKQFGIYQILVKNNYVNSAILSDIGRKGITSKEQHYGIGFSNLHRITQGYKNFSYTILRDNTAFTVTLFLKE